MIGILVLVAFAAAQGAVVFATAWLALRLLKTSGGGAKAIAMAMSFAGWVTVTLVGYFMLGGDGGFMDGFGFVLSLCLSALASSLIYMLAWISRRRAQGT
ncbi:hypothetical protein LJR225_002731 [Phenylobacterium sp. LjRoot225]|uniref:hypothetical protein n=1 Tax=Phenylobacterium sp. LjRoot225 TaxID=3342285 RepID=UPI003ECE70E3